ncbi:MAG: YqgE/AlgH family protein [Methylobacteriaceae bacterium]|nr:YqgE/AlgH family protein [Methylobacteriaceae bacterium]MBV9217981.1 YqgE/AlgH family protein [Methylobacteriaceae bacterium]MBV9247019.1 YqgE/AlgH family protein [Methylobacteriaceae bacterium]MBV9636714.1 YqgE/AlgH family protein [Methylobacteriaceae bacterium]MBV9704045.1 YqgE/AlgH family protein [Methylobacteriaceae bacterium]
MREDRPKQSSAARGYLDGQLLVAMPSMGDPRFARTIIYLCAHSAEGALGIVVNKPAKQISFPDLLVQLKVIEAEDAIRLPPRAAAVQVLQGGPVETGRGFVLHSADFFDQSTLPVDDNICLTATVDILRAIARGDGPARAVLALGYAGWSPGQLDQEIQANGWLSCPADPGLLFDDDLDSKYERSLNKIGVDLAMLSSQAGRA